MSAADGTPADGAAANPRMVRHGRMDLALWKVRAGEGRPLLLLHGLGESTRSTVPTFAEAWPGPVHGLDFSGHGASSLSRGGGYTAEIMLADADAALAVLGEATVLGRGLGAYVALLLAGARPAAVKGVVLADGPGLIGGGVQPGSPSVPFAPAPTSTPDPYALLELAADVRPPDYTSIFIRFVFEGSDLPDPIIVSAVGRAEWLDAVVEEPGVLQMPIVEALAHLADLAPR